MLKLMYLAWTEHYLNGYLLKETLVWSEGRTEWQPLSSIPELWMEINQQGPDYSAAGIAFLLFLLWLLVLYFVVIVRQS